MPQGTFAERIRAALQRAGCPTHPAQIFLSDAFYTMAVRNARFLRDRFTFLDLADVYPLGGDLTTAGRTEEIVFINSSCE